MRNTPGGRETREICDRLPFPQKSEAPGRRSRLLHAESPVVRSLSGSGQSSSKLVCRGSTPLAKVGICASAKSREIDPRFFNACLLSSFVRPRPKLGSWSGVLSSRISSGSSGMRAVFSSDQSRARNQIWSGRLKNRCREAAFEITPLGTALVTVTAQKRARGRARFVATH